jgi:hypothetical protein
MIIKIIIQDFDGKQQASEQLTQVVQRDFRALMQGAA